jgi:DNA repair protein RadA/Sms
MARARTVHRCQSCGAASPKWVGRCPGCDEWGTLVEEVDVVGPAASGLPAPERPVPIAEVDAGEFQPRPVGLPELDRVLAGGLVPGSVTLLGGEPGIGKSTLLLQAAAAVAATGATVLYISAEESRQQVRLRAERLGALRPRLLIASDTALPHVMAHVDEVRPDLLIVDSIQTVHLPELSSAAGSVAQVRECAARLVTEAKGRDMATLLVGHVTKEGSLAGPRVLEHLVDTVLAFEGDRHHALRLLRAVKHRYGATSELGVFEMCGQGLVAVADPSELFLADRLRGVPGSVVVPVLEGHRPMLVEVQALVAPTKMPAPRRTAEGVDPRRLGLLLAVLDTRAGVATSSADVYALAVGGVQVEDPGADLGVTLAVASSATGQAVAGDTVAFGEVGLGGELRQVAQAEARLREAARLGLRRAVVPVGTTGEEPAGLEVVRVATLRDALVAAGVDVPVVLPLRPEPERPPRPRPAPRLIQRTSLPWEEEGADPWT